MASSAGMTASFPFTLIKSSGVLKKSAKWADSSERVQFILASTAIHKDWDARISPENKSWARTIPMPQEADSGRMAAYVIDQVHPGLTNLLMDRARGTFSTPEKSSVLQKLKQEPAVCSSAPTKKHEPER